jgi:hypothetical protein
MPPWTDIDDVVTAFGEIVQGLPADPHFRIHLERLSAVGEERAGAWSEMTISAPQG